MAPPSGPWQRLGVVAPPGSLRPHYGRWDAGWPGARWLCSDGLILYHPTGIPRCEIEKLVLYWVGE